MKEFLIDTVLTYTEIFSVEAETLEEARAIVEKAINNGLIDVAYADLETSEFECDKSDVARMCLRKIPDDCWG